MPSPLEFPRTTKLRHIIVGLILLSGYSYVNQLSIYNSYLQEDNTFPQQIHAYEGDMHFVMERPSEYESKVLYVKIWQDEENSTRFPVLCYKQGCMDEIAKLPLRYKPTEIITLKTAFGDEFLRSMRYLDKYNRTEIIFIQDEKYFKNYYLNIKLKLYSFLGLHFFLLGLVGYTLYPNKAFAKNVHYSQTFLELTVLATFCFILYRLSGQVFSNIAMSRIEYYPIMALLLLCILLAVLYVSENIVIRYNRNTGNIEVLPSSSMDEMNRLRDGKVRKNVNVFLKTPRGKVRRRKFDELPDPSINRNDGDDMQVSDTKKTSSMDSIKSVIEYQGETTESSAVPADITHQQSDIISTLLNKVKNKITDLKRGNYETKFDKEAQSFLNKATRFRDDPPESQKKFISIDEMADDINFNDIDPEILELMNPSKRHHND